jgi:hypothetical protein
MHFGEGARVDDVRVAGNDVLDLDLVNGAGQRVSLQVAFLDRRSLVGRTVPALTPELVGPEDHTMGLCTCQRGDQVHFALVLYTGGREAAEQRAAQIVETEVDRAFSDRMAFWDRLPPCPAGDDETWARLYAKACSVLKVNTMTPEGRIGHCWTTPDRWPHRHMWLWDSAFHAPAYAHLDPDWGHDALLAVLGMQREDGFIAHMMTPVQTSQITQPPILAWACWEAYQVTEDRGFLQQAYPALCRYLEWDMKNRDWNGNGLLGWLIEGQPLCRSGESGMDNSSRFDRGGPWDSVDMNAYAVNDMRCVAHIARTLGRGPEAVQWDGRAEALSNRVNRLLWDEESGFYYDRELDGDLLPIKSNAGFLPLFAGIASAGQAARLVTHLSDPTQFWPHLPVPTIALDEPSYEPDMWRGPTWININRLICLGLRRYGYHDLACELRQRTLDEINRWYKDLGCLYEFYDCRGEIPPPMLNRKGAPGRAGGTGFGVISDYNWTAACTALMLWEAA